MATATVPTVTLNNGVEMPILGFGVFQIPPGRREQAVTEALDAGYRSLDTAALLQERRGRRPRDRGERHPPRRAVRHDEAVDSGPRRGQGQARLRGVTRSVSASTTSTCT